MVTSVFPCVVGSEHVRLRPRLHTRAVQGIRIGSWLVAVRGTFQPICQLGPGYCRF